MSNCSDCNECNECVDDNPCYEGCGCLNPTTFECITVPGSGLNYVPITTSMNGKQVLAAINAAIGTLQASIAEIVAPTEDGSDIKVKVSGNDTLTGYLGSKIGEGSHIQINTLNPSGNEILRIAVTPNTLISADAGNVLTLGTDPRLKVSIPTFDGGKIIQGSNISVSGTGTSSDPYVISSPNSILPVRPCFDGIWRTLPLNTLTTSGLVYVTGSPKYRIRYDGTIELKGTATYTVTFGAYNSSTYSLEDNIGVLPSTCLTLTEQTGAADLKSIFYTDVPTGTFPEFYSYLIRKSNNSIRIQFNSGFKTGKTKTIVVSFDGVVIHPNI
jgi:hypothetical protein